MSSGHVRTSNYDDDADADSDTEGGGFEIVEPMTSFRCGEKRWFVYPTIFSNVAIFVLLICQAVTLYLLVYCSFPTASDTPSTLSEPLSSPCPTHFSQYRFPMLLNGTATEELRNLFVGDQCTHISTYSYASLYDVIHVVKSEITLTSPIDSYIFPEYDTNVTDYTCQRPVFNHSMCDGTESQYECLLSWGVTQLSAMKLQVCFANNVIMSDYIDREYLYSFLYGCRGTFRILFDEINSTSTCVTYSYRVSPPRNHETTILPLGTLAKSVPEGGVGTNGDDVTGGAGRRLSSTWTHTINSGTSALKYVEGLLNTGEKAAKEFEAAKKQWDSLQMAHTSPPEKGSVNVITDRHDSIVTSVDNIRIEAELDFEMYWWFHAYTVNRVTTKSNLTYIRWNGSLNVRATTPTASVQLPIWKALTLTVNNIYQLVDVQIQLDLSAIVEIDLAAGVRLEVDAYSMTSSLESQGRDGPVPVIGAGLSGSASADASVTTTIAFPIIANSWIQMSAVGWVTLLAGPAALGPAALGPAALVGPELAAALLAVLAAAMAVEALFQPHVCVGYVAIPYVQLDFVVQGSVGASVQWQYPPVASDISSTTLDTCTTAGAKVCVQAGLRVMSLFDVDFVTVWVWWSAHRTAISNVFSTTLLQRKCFELIGSPKACANPGDAMALPQFDQYAQADLCPLP
jgi:hypothetical protein